MWRIFEAPFVNPEKGFEPGCWYALHVETAAKKKIGKANHQGSYEGYYDRAVAACDKAIAETVKLNLRDFGEAVYLSNLWQELYVYDEQSRTALEYIRKYEPPQ